MNSNLLNDILNFKHKKLLIWTLTITAFLTYGYFITHSTIGVDDTAIERYFIEGWAPYVGRWTLFLLNILLGFAHYTPYFMDALGVILLCLAAYLFCILWDRISNHTVHPLSLVAFSTVFITCPLIGEVYVYYLHNGISFSFVLMAFIGLCWWNYLSAPTWKQLIPMTLFLSLAIGCYESFALVYLVLICGIYIYSVTMGTLKTRKINACLKDLAFAVLPLIGSIGIRTIMYSAINMVLGLDSEARGISAISLWFVNNPIILLKDLIYKFLMRYVLNAEYIFGVRIFLILTFCFIVTIAVTAIAKKKWILIPLGLIMIVIPWLLIPVELVVTPYRACQALMLFLAFACFCLFEMLLRISNSKVSKPLRYILILLLAITVFRQSFELHHYFYFDYLRSEYDRNYCRELAQELISEHDITKPVIFIGQREYPEALRANVYLPADSEEYAHFVQQFNLHYTKALYNYTDDYGYKIYDIATMDTLDWLSWADFANSEYEIYRYMEMLGYHFQRPSYEARQNAIQETMTREDYPVWPQKSSIVETDEYIYVYLGPLRIIL